MPGFTPNRQKPWKRLSPRHWPQKARDPRLAAMTQEDLVYEVLKECFDPEIPLNVVDLGLIYEVKAGTETVDIKMSVTSPACPSGAAIAEDIKTKLSNAGFPNPKVQIVFEPAWSPQRISEAGRRRWDLTENLSSRPTTASQTA